MTSYNIVECHQAHIRMINTVVSLKCSVVGIKYGWIPLGTIFRFFLSRLDPVSRANSHPTARNCINTLYAYSRTLPILVIRKKLFCYTAKLPKLASYLEGELNSYVSVSRCCAFADILTYELDVLSGTYQLGYDCSRDIGAEYNDPNFKVYKLKFFWNYLNGLGCSLNLKNGL